MSEKIALERRHGATNYDPLPVVFARGEGCWLWDENGAALRAAKAVVRAMYKDALAESDDGRRAALARWALMSENAQRLRAAVTLAPSCVVML